MPALPRLRRVVVTVVVTVLALLTLAPARTGLEGPVRGLASSRIESNAQVRREFPAHPVIPVPLALIPAARPAPPKVNAASVVVMNFDTGTVLFAKRGREERPIASLTKIMTAMLVLRSTRMSERVTASAKAARQVPTKLGLKAGQRMRVDELLYALLLHSSNDVAVALAEHVAGSVRAFDRRMTERARDLGMSHTWFGSPSGLNDKGYSTARDVARMTRWAYGSATFAEIAATRFHRLRMPTGQWIRLENLNDLLFEYPGAVGVKTGYTSESRWSLVGLAERGHLRMLVVLLGDPDVPFEDGEALLDWAFARESGLISRTA